MVYLYHFSSPIGHSSHYLGFSKSIADFKIRQENHQKGKGARLLQVALEKGIAFEVVRTWKKGTKHYERYLKNLRGTKHLCPCCNPRAMNNAKGDGLLLDAHPSVVKRMMYKQKRMLDKMSTHINQSNNYHHEQKLCDFRINSIDHPLLCRQKPEQLPSISLYAEYWREVDLKQLPY